MTTWKNRFVITLALGVALVWSSAAMACPGDDASGAKAPRKFETAPAIGTAASCAVSGKQLTVTAETPRSTYDGHHYVFVCPGKKVRFDADPARYAADDYAPGGGCGGGCAGDCGGGCGGGGGGEGGCGAKKREGGGCGGGCGGGESLPAKPGGCGG